MIDFTGVWKANLEKSRFLGPPPKALTMKIEQSETELHQEIVVTRPDGNEDRMTFNCWINGEQNRNSLNGQPIRERDAVPLIVQADLLLAYVHLLSEVSTHATR